jgi:hypothetical protein
MALQMQVTPVNTYRLWSQMERQLREKGMGAKPKLHRQLRASWAGDELELQLLHWKSVGSKI